MAPSMASNRPRSQATPEEVEEACGIIKSILLSSGLPLEVSTTPSAEDTTSLREHGVPVRCHPSKRVADEFNSLAAEHAARGVRPFNKWLKGCAAWHLMSGSTSSTWFKAAFAELRLKVMLGEGIFLVGTLGSI